MTRTMIKNDSGSVNSHGIGYIMVIFMVMVTVTIIVMII